MDRPDDAKPLAPHPKPRVRAAAACSSHDKLRPREDEAEEVTENSTP